MQNLNPRKSQANGEVETPGSESNDVLLFLSIDEILAKTLDFLEPCDYPAINLFLKSIHRRISKKMSASDKDSGENRYKECAETFYCVFNLLIHLFKASKHNNLQINTGALLEFYFIFLNTFQEDHNLCFIQKDSKFNELYEIVHPDKLSTKSHNESPDKLRENVQAASENIEKAENEVNENKSIKNDEIAHEEEANENQDLEIKIASANDLGGETSPKDSLSVDLLVVELLEEIFEKVEAKNAKEIVDSLFKYYDAMSLSVFSYMIKAKPFDISFPNRISLCAIKSLRWIGSSEEIQKACLTKLASNKTGYLEFFFTVLGLNMAGVSQDLVTTKIKLSNNILEALHKKESRERGRGSLEDFIVTISEFELLIKTDKSLSNKENLITMFKDIIIVRTLIYWKLYYLFKIDISRLCGMAIIRIKK